MKLLTLFAALSIASSISGCATWPGAATATEAARCEIWGKSLPTRSRSDTAQMQAEISRAYAAFLLACPDHYYLLPE